MLTDYTQALPVTTAAKKRGDQTPVASFDNAINSVGSLFERDGDK
jgi:hypothetical protein